MALTYETPHLFAPEVAHGILRQELEKKRATDSRQTFLGQRDNGSIQFVKLPYEQETVNQVIELAQSFHSYSQVVVIGVGGSDLGVRAAFEALCHPYWNIGVQFRGDWPELYFAGDSTDPEVLSHLLDILRPEQVLIVMISKSGKTIEQMSSFLVLYDRLITELGQEQADRQVITITDPAGGTLREMTNQYGWASLAHHETGGRFSVLSTVGLFPLALVGVDVQMLIQGARDLDQRERKGSFTGPFDYAHQHVVGYENGLTQNVLFAYKNSLSEFGRWYRQLWAESLGKRFTIGGKEVFTGMTPTACIGPRDQHSQVQLYVEGPADKLFTFLTVSQSDRDVCIPAKLPENDFVKQFANLSLNHILHAEYIGTAAALAEAGRPSVHLEIEKLDAYHLGALFYFFELATAYAGVMLDIDPFNQPGVERGKVLMYEHLHDK